MCRAAAAALAALILAGAALFGRLAAAPPPSVEIAAYTTGLRGRTQSQRHNARLAAEALDGKVVQPGAVFSFNRTVRSWSLDQGYVKAPVSFDGELVRAFGGGVCQTSTTLYNAALLAGLPIVERHPHTVAPGYAPPGRDAAVAQVTIDLRFRNPYPWPIQIRAGCQGDRLDVRLLASHRPQRRCEIMTKVLSHTTPQRLTQVVPSTPGRTQRNYLRSPGCTGYRVVTWRAFLDHDQEVARERLGDDTYRGMDRVIALTE